LGGGGGGGGPNKSTGWFLVGLVVFPEDERPNVVDQRKRAPRPFFGGPTRSLFTEKYWTKEFGTKKKPTGGTRGIDPRKGGREPGTRAGPPTTPPHWPPPQTGQGCAQPPPNKKFKRNEDKGGPGKGL